MPQPRVRSDRRARGEARGRREGEEGQLGSLPARGRRSREHAQAPEARGRGREVRDQEQGPEGDAARSSTTSSARSSTPAPAGDEKQPDRRGRPARAAPVHDRVRAARRHAVEAMGQPFDPNLHEAISQQESDQPPGTVVQVLQRGYERAIACCGRRSSSSRRRRPTAE